MSKQTQGFIIATLPLFCVVLAMLFLQSCTTYRDPVNLELCKQGKMGCTWT